MLFFLACFSIKNTNQLQNSHKEATQPTVLPSKNQERRIQIFLWDTNEQKLIPRARTIFGAKPEQAALNILYKGPLPNEQEKSLSLLNWNQQPQSA